MSLVVEGPAGRDGERTGPPPSWSPPTLPVAFGLVVAAVLSAAAVGAGLRLLAKSTAPVQFGLTTDGDQSYPVLFSTIAAVLVVALGAGLMVAVVAALRGNKAVTLALAVLLALAAAGAVPEAIRRGDGAGCVEDTYTGARVCTSQSWVTPYHLATTTLPLAVGAAGLFTAPRRPTLRGQHRKPEPG